MEATALVTALALIQYQVFAALVGRARGRTGVKAPATTGHPEFERYFAVQRNTLEQLVTFLPALWLFSYYVNGWAAAGLGLVFVFGRSLYFSTYVKDPAKRGPGFIIGQLAHFALILGALVGPLLKMI